MGRPQRLKKSDTPEKDAHFLLNSVHLCSGAGADASEIASFCVIQASSNFSDSRISIAIRDGRNKCSVGSKWICPPKFGVFWTYKACTSPT